MGESHDLSGPPLRYAGPSDSASTRGEGSGQGGLAGRGRARSCGPSFGPAWAVRLPYRWSFTPGSARIACSHCGSPSAQRSPSRLTIAAGDPRSHSPRGKPAERADLLLELAGASGLDRQVSRVVGPGRDLVDEQPTVRRQEELDAEHADGVERLGDRESRVARFLRYDRPHRRGGRRAGKDVPLMMVEARRIGDRLAVAAADDDDRHLGGELDPGFGHAGRPAEVQPGRCRRPSACSTSTCPLPS